MTTRRDKKKRGKRRGSREHGYGKIGQHRKGGQRGGKGKYTGAGKHLWSYIVNNEPNYFGKKGFKRPPSYQQQFKVININDLEKLAIKLNAKEINLKDLGFEKVLGRGKISRSLKISAKAFTKVAIEKIEAAGGQCIRLN